MALLISRPPPNRDPRLLYTTLRFGRCTLWPVNKQSYDLFLALVALGCLAVLALAIVIALWRLATGAVPGWAAELTRAARRGAPVFAFAAAAGSMAGSLIYSEHFGLVPCTLCWVQRGFMYPLAILLGVALLVPRWRRLINMVSVVVATGGLAVSIWHRYEQATGTSVGVSCAVDNPCSSRFVDEFGFITIPTMAGIGFALVIVFTAIQLSAPRSTKGTNSELQ